MATAEFTFSHSLRVRWAEVDRQGIVFNGHYLAYFDVGITEYWRALGYPYPDGLLQHGTDLYVKKASLEYHASAQYDDVLSVMVRVARIGRSSLQFLIEIHRIEIHRGTEHLISGEVLYVNADPATRKSQPVPDFLRQAIGKLERIPPETASARA
jgi:acyl-CoA thioester hydrolase